MSSTRIIGLTGNIACGKSTVAGILERLGAAVIDADQLAREVVKPGMPALGKIVEQFGPEMLDALGALDRPRMRKIVFADEQKKERLEAILHPEIQKLSRELIDGYTKEGRPLVVYEAALLVETGRYRDFDGLMVVACDVETQKRRLMARDAGISEELASQIISSQMPMSRKIAVAEWVIQNDGTVEDLRRRVSDWYHHLKGDVSNA